MRDPLPGSPAPAPTRAFRARTLALALAAVLAFATASPWNALRPGGDLASLLRRASLDQRWDMFSPDPARSDGWLRAPAVLADGAAIDVLTGGPADDRNQRYSDPLYSRWVKVHERIASVGYGAYRSQYALGFCRMRNLHRRPGQSPIVSLELYWVERTVRAPEEGPPLISERRLWSQQC